MSIQIKGRGFFNDFMMPLSDLSNVTYVETSEELDRGSGSCLIVKYVEEGRFEARAADCGERHHLLCGYPHLPDCTATSEGTEEGEGGDSGSPGGNGGGGPPGDDDGPGGDTQEGGGTPGGAGNEPGDDPLREGETSSYPTVLENLLNSSNDGIFHSL